jgi:hypothetical protein
MDDRVDKALDRLRAAEAARREAVSELIQLGVIRSRGLVADYGEALAARYYGVELQPPSTPGFDLITRDGLRVQVRALRSTPGNYRRSMGFMKDPYDLLLAVRLDQDYRPIYAIEVPRDVLERHYAPGTRISLTNRLENDPGVRRIEAETLLTEGAARGARSRTND